MTFTVDADFVKDFLESLKPETTRGVAVAGSIKDQAISQLLGTPEAPKAKPGAKRKLSPEAIERIRAAQKRRWAAHRKANK